MTISCPADPAEGRVDPLASRRAFLIFGVGTLFVSAYVRGVREANAATRPPLPPSARFGIGTVPFATLATALAALRDGQTLDIAPGDYPADAGYSKASNITIRCVGGEAVFHAQHGGKSTFVLAGNNVTLANLAGEGIINSDGNGGLVRFEGANLTAAGIRIDHCQTGILTGNAHPASIVRLANLKGTKNGTPGDGQSHAIYIGVCAELRITDADLSDTFIGHLIKSRAARNLISGCKLVEGRASRAIDICNGGVLKISNTYIKQTQETDNPDIIGYGAECAKDAAGNRQPSYPLNTIDIAADVRCFDTRNPLGEFVDRFLAPTVYTNRGTYNIGTDPYP
jgi:hypothetical protein